jgi:hypothetical protein
VLVVVLDQRVPLGAVEFFGVDACLTHSHHHRRRAVGALS